MNIPFYYKSAVIFSMPETVEQALNVKSIAERISACGINLMVCQLTYEKLNVHQIDLSYFCSVHDCSETDFIISIGGDGTVLKASHYVELHNKPILAINAGRLGFLADICQDEIETVCQLIKQGNFFCEERSVLEVSILNKTYFALNEVAVHKQSLASLLTINTRINGEFLCSYWSDGLIVATPTGSTAYSLSLGGPIISPNTKAIVLNPIAPHTLSMRPLIIPDDSEITLSVSGRIKEYEVSFDSDQIILDKETDIIIKKSDTTVKFIKFEKSSYYSNLREKLKWGIDIRN